MSYNTRRNTGNTQSPQVSYHQGPNTPQRGGAAPQRPGGPNAAYASHFSTPVSYNTQPGYNKPQDIKPVVAAGVVVQQPPLPQQPAAPQQQPQAAAAVQQQQQQPPQPQATAAAPPLPVEKMEAQDSETNGASATPAGSGTKPAWMKKVAGVKVNKVQKRRRQNARLRKILVPKNALMAINEICPGPKFVVQEHTNALNQTIYSVRLEVDGKIHSGQSINKTHAKQMACENALKDILVSRMQMQSQEQPGDKPSDFFKQQEDAADKDETMSNDGSLRGGSSRHPEDDMPWGCLASFALHKLFIEWQNQGVEIPMATAQPIMRKGRAPSLNKSGATPAAGSIHPIKKIPEDAHKKHPVLMLNHLQPGLQYSERIDGALPNAIFVFSVSIDGQEFSGSGTTKKEAKKECAKAALVKFGIISEY